MKPIETMRRLGSAYALDVLSAPVEQRERALADMQERCYMAAVARGVPPRNAMRWAKSTERTTRALLRIIQLRL